mgnify:CR=1 FL=1
MTREGPAAAQRGPGELGGQHDRERGRDAERKASAEGAETLSREKEALEEPIRALMDEGAALRASLEAKETELADKEAERRRLVDDEEDSRRRVAEVVRGPASSRTAAFSIDGAGTGARKGAESGVHLGMSILRRNGR